MNNLSYPEEALETEAVVVTFAIVGAGAADATVPQSHSHVVVSGKRSGVGTLTIQAKTRALFPTLLGPVGQPAVVGPNGKKAFITAIDPTAGTIAVQVKDNTDTAAELVAAETLYVTCRFRNSKAKYGGAA